MNAVGVLVHAVKSETILGRPKKARCGFRFPRGTRHSASPVTCLKCIKKS